MSVETTPKVHRRSSVRKYGAKLIRSKDIPEDIGNDVLMVNIPSFYTKTEIIQKPRILNVPVMPGKEINIPVGGLSTSYFVYKIEIRTAHGHSWKLEKSYNEFRKLHAKIKSKFPAIRKIMRTFPRPKMLSLSSTSPEALYRQKFFQAYLQALLQLKPRIKYLNDFLEVHHHAQINTKKKELNIDDFELIKVLGQGSFGKVFLVRVVGSSDFYAMKALKKEDVKKRRQIEHTKTELRVMGSTNHPFIVTLRYAFSDDSRLFMVSDFCPGGELFFHLRKEKCFPAKVVQFYTAEIALALQYLHDNKIVFRDLKPENILLDQSGHIQLTDFGLSRDNMEDGAEGAKTFCGTPEYLAPEMLIGRSKGKGYGFAVDWWALGTLMYEMFVGMPPFFDMNQKIMLRKIIRARLVLKDTPIPKEARLVIKGFLNRDPEKRLGITGNKFEDIRNNEFYSKFEGGIDFDLLMTKSIESPYKPSEAVDLTNNFDNKFTDKEAKFSKIETKRESRSDTAEELFDEEEEEDVFGDFNFTRIPMDEEFFSTRD